MIVCPELPKEMASYADRYKESHREQLLEWIQASRRLVDVSETDVAVEIEVESGTRPGILIIRQVLKGEHDLVIKQAEREARGKGFRANDMKLLRKCPCPVWLFRPMSHARNEIRVAVAIDPESMAPEGDDLAMRLLEVSSSLADSCSGKLHIISCWDFEFEGAVRHNIWLKVSEEELASAVSDAQNRHRAALDALISKSGIEGRVQVDHVRGRADEVIPKYIEDDHIDMLVIGTLARTGIPGFVIGNTAENILQGVGCSLLALKPVGFVSPVKPY